MSNWSLGIRNGHVQFIIQQMTHHISYLSKKTEVPTQKGEFNFTFLRTSKFKWRTNKKSFKSVEKGITRPAVYNITEKFQSTNFMNRSL